MVVWVAMVVVIIWWLAVSWLSGATVESTVSRTALGRDNITAN